MISKRLGLEKLIGLGFFMALLVASISGIVAISRSVSMSNASTVAAAEAQSSLQATRLALWQQRGLVTSRAYFLQPSRDAIQRYKESLAQFNETYSRLQGTTRDAKGKQLLLQARELYDEGTKNIQRMMDQEAAGDHAGVLNGLTQSVSLSKQIRKSLDDFVEYTSAQAEQQNLRLQNRAQKAIWFSVGGLLLSLVVAIVSSVWTLRTVSMRIRATRQAVDAVANRDLSGGAIEVLTNDALGLAMRSVNEMKQNLSDVVGDLMQIGGQVAAASTELAASSHESSRVADQELECTREVSATLQDMSRAVVEVAQHAERVSSSASEAASEARNGEQTVQVASQKMQQIEHQSGVVARSLEELAEQTEKIGHAANLIEGIAAQTNLLALNAAIEAARAGEHGRGFAVVASEVRRLAERTAVATREIDAMIKTVQNQSHIALTEMRLGSERVAEGVSQTELTSQSLDKILRAVDQAAGLSKQIVDATSKHARNTEALHESLECISDYANKTANASHQSSAACDELSQLAERMHAQLSVFQLPATRLH